MKRVCLSVLLLCFAVCMCSAQQIMYSNLRELVEDRGDVVSILKVTKRTKNQIFLTGGGDYRIEDLPEAPLVASWGGRTVTVEFEYQRSTTALLKKVRGA